MTDGTPAEQARYRRPAAGDEPHRAWCDGPGHERVAIGSEDRISGAVAAMFLALHADHAGYCDHNLL